MASINASFLKVFFGLTVFAGLVLPTPTALADWVNFVNETATRLVSSPDLGAEDVQEKDYAWGDVDQDGDIDLVVVRKEPFTTPGKFPNVLFMNHNGVLRDQTSTFASASDVPGDNGFLTPTNDRDVQLADVDLDGWLDIVTSPAVSVGDPKHIGHPRVYRNLGCTGACNGTEDWLGFIYEEARIPQLLTYTGQDGFNPEFCELAVGDLTGDGYPDLYFNAYDQLFHDKYLINLGEENPGFFVDVTNERFLGLVPGENQPFPISSFGTGAVIGDVNGDQINDIVKATALGSPLYVGVAVNDPTAEGFFDTYKVVAEDAPYFVNAGDLNNDDKLDLVETSDGADRYLLNQSTDAHGLPDFISYVFSFSNTGGDGSPSDDGFGGNSLVADLDNDGWDDVLITSIDVNNPPCVRRMHIYHNLGGSPGDQVTLLEETSGVGCKNFQGNPPTCIIANIPADQLTASHDVAVFDINGDGWKDMVLGRCSGTEVFMNVPPSSPPAGGTPDGNNVPGPPLTVSKELSDQITLSWGASCLLDDNDYAIYEGPITDIGAHQEIMCSTSGATTATFTPGAQNSYYLVVPNNGSFEGSYGSDSIGTPRLQGVSACYSQNVGTCE